MSNKLWFFPDFNPGSDAGLFDHGADCIVNTVNCKGTGKGSRGVAGQVFTRYPAVHDAYMAQCRAGKMFPGAVQLVEVDPRTGEASSGGGLWIANVATKDDWRDKSQLAWVEAIAGKLGKVAERTGAKRFAIPPLGCGEGGLDWNKQVGPVLRPHIEALAALGVESLVFAADPVPSRGGAVSVPSLDNRSGASKVPLGPLSSLTNTAPAPALPPAAASGPGPVFWVAGVGARPLDADNPTGTPPGIAAKMEEVGTILATRGWGLRSGHAEGADMAFEQGFAKVPGARMQIFLPRASFNGARHDGVRYFDVKDPALVAEAEALARANHPAGARLNGFALAAMSRNGFQVLGPDLKSPSTVAILYTKGGGEIGGTGHAMRLSTKNGIPIINLGKEGWRQASAQVIADAAQEVAMGRPLPEPPAPRRADRGSER
jgi:O-acetyl-ADP-ribose deacetylase (regulator of RNase III)